LAHDALGPRQAIRASLSDPTRLQELRGPARIRLQLHHRGVSVGKVDLDRPRGAVWGEVAQRWVGEEALPRLLPRFLRRRAWRDPHLLARLARLLGGSRGRRFLWQLLHTTPGTWAGALTAFLVHHHQDILGRAQATAGALATQRKPWDRAKWESLFAVPDPWGYASTYEQTKYEHTLELLPEGPIHRALELACAEGHFTVQLAPHVETLMAADIAAKALERAAERCAGNAHVSFRQLDMREDQLPAGFDLIVCSEVLYYIGDGADLRRFARRLAAALAPGGHLLVTHANAVVDDPGETGFNWQVGFAAKHIGETLARVRGLELLRELRTPVYRVQLFRRRPGAARRAAPAREVTERSTGYMGGLAAAINWGGCAVTRTEAANAWVSRAVPILMYHRIATDGPAALAPYRVAPAMFDRQLAYLRRHGYRSISMAQWIAALRERDGLIDDRVVVLTFDDAYCDFLTDAWPILCGHGFGATMFVPADHVGGRAEWDRALGEPADLMSWDELRLLAGRGLEIGAHTCSHPYLTRLGPARLMGEGRAGKARLEAELGVPVEVLAYPYGDQNLTVRRAMAACGYVAAVTTQPSLSRLGDNPMALPRQLVAGGDDLDAFIALLGPLTRGTLDRRLRYRYLRLRRKNLM
jgi:peptidoglycan/xylan/chitin deacetylase (PgdA/CDA1 family)/SAM-dependent methyltransferase